ncbi:CHAT domain-containing protein [[Leptolyngbya] sp. PCC 7376]|uniref:CHAT domain-containing protein n=1 Tax=[Leptolyngbya] sp. PCC 7376 TaxID=111781 RepID=UPI001C1E4F16|nr:CHAT domain-containing protein [[Leptolyngbya] sp. PCC 7376]
MLTSLGISLPAASQPITAIDGGTGTTVISSGDQWDIGGGTLSGDGQNLFHDFERFGLESGQTANFLSQPDIANILGRISGGETSFIDGLLQVSGSNANLYLLNPAGIIFGGNASLNVGGDFTATTATGIGFGEDQWLNAFGNVEYEFLNGSPTQLAFDLEQSAPIINTGNLSVTRESNLSLVAGSVNNQGRITSASGFVNIVGVEGQNTVRITQPHNILTLEVEPPRDSAGLLLPITAADLPELLTSSTQQQDYLVNGADGELALLNAPGLITNDGTLQGQTINIDGRTLLNRNVINVNGTNGGTVDIQTQYFSNSAGGEILADGTEGDGGIVSIESEQSIIFTADSRFSAKGNFSGGSISLNVGESGNQLISGTINVSGENGAGGEVTITGDRLGIFGAKITADGATDGGEILIGGDYQGSGDLQRSSTTTVGLNSEITANALTDGDGGKVVLWSDGITNFGGAIEAKGGAISGDGGLVEVSGLGGGTFAGEVDASAPNGEAGNLLLDPKNIDITDGGIAQEGWSLAQTFTSPNPAFNDQAGLGIALDGDNILLGVYLDDTGAPDAGAAYLFNTDGTLLQTFNNPTPANGDLFGQSLAIEDNDILISARADDTGAVDAGSVYLFDTNGVLQRTFNNPIPGGYEFGFSLAKDGDNVLIFSYVGTNDGEVALFDIDGTLLRTYTNPSPAAFDNFGRQLSISGTNVLLASETDDTLGFDIGQAYLFDTSGSLLRTYNNPNPAPNASDNFGRALAIEGDNLLIAAWRDDTDAIDAGIAYLFDTNGNLLQTYNNPNPAFEDNFGITLDIDGDNILIGSQRDDIGATDTGSAYLFDRASGNLLQTFNNPNPANADLFGRAVAIDGTNILIGAILDDVGAVDSGAAYLYSLDTTPTLFNDNPDGSFTFDADLITNVTNTGTAFSLQANNDISINESIISNNPVGDGGALTFQAGRSIIINANIFTDNGSLTLTANDPNALLTSRDAGSGDLTIASGVTLDTGNSVMNLSGETLSGDGNLQSTFGNINLNFSDTSSVDSVITAGGNVDISATNNLAVNSITTAGGNINLTSSLGEVIAGTLNTSSGKGGNVSLIAQEAVTTGTINTNGTTGNGGNVFIDPIGDVEVAYIDAQGGSGGIGGTVDITAGQYFRATGTFIDQNGQPASIATIGSLGNGSVTIRHGGQGVIPFEIGNSSTNGTAGIISSGAFSFLLSESFLSSITRGDLILSTTSSATPQPTTPPLISTPLVTNPVLSFDFSNITLDLDDSISKIQEGVDPTFQDAIVFVPLSKVKIQENSSVIAERADNFFTSAFNNYFASGKTATAQTSNIATNNTNNGSGAIANNSSTPTSSNTISNGGAITNSIATTDSSSSASTQSNGFTNDPNTITDGTTQANAATNTPAEEYHSESNSTIASTANEEITESSSGKTSLNDETSPNASNPSGYSGIDLQQSGTSSNAIDEEELSTAAKTADDDDDDDEGLSIAEAQAQFRKVQDSTGITPAIIHAIFIPTKGELKNKDQLQLILTPTEGEPLVFRVDATREEVYRLVAKLHRAVSNQRLPASQIWKPSQKLYQLLIEPLQADLERLNIEHIALSVDHGLRSLPWAVLNDGTNFLVEDYSLSLMPSLMLTNLEYTDVRNLDILAMGASEFADASPLPAVPLELNIVSDVLWEGQSYLNDGFSIDNLKTIRNEIPYRLLHLATHGEFKQGLPNNSYIQFGDQKLGLNELRELGLHKPPVEMMVLSACKTAIGDYEAELGFAGLAVMAGVKSSLGSLWYISDEGTLGLIADFYQQLQEAPIKSEALRQTQLAMLRGDVQLKAGELVTSNQSFPLTDELKEFGDRQLTHPYYWSSFVIIGNPW